MDSNKSIKEIIDESVEIALIACLDNLQEIICRSIGKPEYQKWGKFLTPKQAATYVGCKSINGMKSLLGPLDIKPTKVNSKSVRYDREDLDKVNVTKAFHNYKKSLA